MAITDTWSWIQFVNTMSGVVAGGSLTILSGWFLFTRQRQETHASELRALERASAKEALDIVAQIARYPRKPEQSEEWQPSEQDEREAHDRWLSGRNDLLANLMATSLDLPDELYQRVKQASEAMGFNDGMWLTFHLPELRERRVREVLCDDIIDCLRATRRRQRLPEPSVDVAAVLGWSGDFREREEEIDRKAEESYREAMRRRAAAES
ncbi:hypothetical protein [Nonomuraea sp. NPDC049758]|uniref:hypothetical protein n=1 Tax=Nonomuraea sp. NPDC049758 TaxID=3154360 RepID=UPI00343CE4F9